MIRKQNCAEQRHLLTFKKALRVEFIIRLKIKNSTTPPLISLPSLTMKFSSIILAIFYIAKCESQDTSCSPPLQNGWVVENTEDASALSRATNCTGGTFGVRWTGPINIIDTISIHGDTKLTITGFENAVVDGGYSSHFLDVVGGEVHLRDIQVENCLGSLGGAIHSESSIVTCHGTNFSSNTAE